MSAFSRHPSPSTDSSNRNSNGTRIYAPNAIFNGGWKSSEYDEFMYVIQMVQGFTRPMLSSTVGGRAVSTSTTNARTTAAQRTDELPFT